MIIRNKAQLTDNDVTDEHIYQRRRRFLKTLAMGSVAIGTGIGLEQALARPSKEGDTLTELKDITSYNNFYEFGFSKEAPAKNAHRLTTSPWTITVDGACEKPGEYTLEDILKPHAIEERIYRLRCVEGWSMVVPWQGFSLGDLLKRFNPSANAKYVRFSTLHRPTEMHGQKTDVLDWPYTEGLRMDEAMNPLATLATGLYGKSLPKQNGAPLRLVVPWKYGFKSIKSIVHIRFVEKQPISSWMTQASREYGFYANVNPNVSHPRWSQRKERRIGEFRKRKTLPFNGYSEQVADLYKGMNLKRFY
jgi:sulfoxide reductase catalytic subunit YedY